MDPLDLLCPVIPDLSSSFPRSFFFGPTPYQPILRSIAHDCTHLFGVTGVPLVSSPGFLICI